MNIAEIMNEKMIKLQLDSKDKISVIRELAELLYENDKLYDKEKYIEAVLKREEEFSTGVGMGIAIPHGKSSAVKEPSIAFGRSKEGIEYGSLDGLPAQLFFIIAVPENSNDEHLRLLGQISRKLMHREVREKLLNAETFNEIIEALK
ncbi:PTS sugar transporter subunit IIA [Caloramator sp. E03]|uniref:PTS sugar transporter subunit IIA n=1 Tax=Caloramator sp. E03 TaxID=2576307 RepID=UPI00111005E5|nr:PTS sugar transporter subunit IIA [Caloramator sp. E03]QCX34408.1 PTS sugar transporter subunit IIA [Caloramator sp. E03]